MPCGCGDSYCGDCAKDQAARYAIPPAQPAPAAKAPVWIIKVEDQYLASYDREGGSARCEIKQRHAIRFKDLGKAYRVAARTFGLAEEPDDFAARVVKLVPRSHPARPQERCAHITVVGEQSGKRCCLVEGHEGPHDTIKIPTSQE